MFREEGEDMAMIWLSVHLVGVAIAFLLMFIIQGRKIPIIKACFLWQLRAVL